MPGLKEEDQGTEPGGSLLAVTMGQKVLGLTYHNCIQRWEVNSPGGNQTADRKGQFMLGRNHKKYSSQKH